MNSLAQATWIQLLNYSYKNCMIIFTETNPSNFVNYLSCGQFPFFPEICGLPNYRAQRKKGKEKGKDKKKKEKKKKRQNMERSRAAAKISVQKFLKFSSTYLLNLCNHFNALNNWFVNKIVQMHFLDFI